MNWNICFGKEGVAYSSKNLVYIYGSDCCFVMRKEAFVLHKVEGKYYVSFFIKSGSDWVKTNNPSDDVIDVVDFEIEWLLMEESIKDSEPVKRNPTKRDVGYKHEGVGELYVFLEKHCPRVYKYLDYMSNTFHKSAA